MSAPTWDSSILLEQAAPPRKPLVFHFSVSIANLGAGHNFPTGFAFARQVWLDVTATDASGTVVLRSGALDPNGDLAAQRCNKPTQQLVTRDAHLLLDSDPTQAERRVELVKNDLQLDGLDEAVLRKGGQAALLLVLQAQQTNNEAPFEVKAGANGETVKGQDGCVINLQTELFSLNPDGTQSGERDAFVQTRVLARFDAACQGRLLALGLSDEQQLAECIKGPAKAYGIIAGQRITATFSTLPVSSGPLTIQVALRFRNYPPYFLRALAKGMQDRGEPGDFMQRGEQMVEELLRNTVTLHEATATVEISS